MKRKLIILGLSGTLLGAGLVSAQTGQSGGTAQDAQAQTQATDQTIDQTTARRSIRLAHLLLGRPLTLGSTLNVAFYDGDSEAGGSELQTIEFVYGEDSEAAFAQELTTAAATEASYVTVTTSPQTETYNLDEAETFLRDGFGRDGRGLEGDFGGFGGRGRHY